MLRALVEYDSRLRRGRQLWQEESGGRSPRVWEELSRPPFIRTPPATACRSLFFSLLIKAKRFLCLPLKVGTWGTAAPRAGARPYSGGSEVWGHRMEMGLRAWSARCSIAKEGQRRCVLSVGSAGAQLVGAVLRLCLFQSCASRKLWSVGFKNPLLFS